MKWQNLIKVAFKSIFKNKMRTALTMLGIIIGVAAVIVMVAIGQGAQKRVETQIANMGTNLLMIHTAAMHMGGVSQGAQSGKPLTMEDAARIKKNAAFISDVSPVERTGVQAIGGNGNWNTSCYGVSEDYLDIRNWPLASGEMFTAADVRAQNKVCIVGKTIVKELFDGEDPVGQQIRLRTIPFRIIGVLTERGQNAFGMDQDDVIMAPITTVLYRMSGSFEFGIHQILVRANSLKDMPRAQEEAAQILRESHRIQEGEDDDFEIRNQTEFANLAQESTQTFTLLLASIASISLLVGGIGIMNIMLVSVTERTREIGIRMALGARGRDVLVQFLIESMTLSLSGGIAGILLGLLSTWIVRLASGWSTAILPSTVLLSFGFAGAVGIFFGFYPARKASQLNPIEALRYE